MDNCLNCEYFKVFKRSKSVQLTPYLNYRSPESFVCELNGIIIPNAEIYSNITPCIYFSDIELKRIKKKDVIFLLLTIIGE